MYVLIIKAIKFELTSSKPPKRNLQIPTYTLQAFGICLPLEGGVQRKKKEKNIYIPLTHLKWKKSLSKLKVAYLKLKNHYASTVCWRIKNRTKFNHSSRILPNYVYMIELPITPRCEVIAHFSTGNLLVTISRISISDYSLCSRKIMCFLTLRAKVFLSHGFLAFTKSFVRDRQATRMTS